MIFLIELSRYDTGDVRVCDGQNCGRPRSASSQKGAVRGVGENYIFSGTNIKLLSIKLNYIELRG